MAKNFRNRSEAGQLLAAKLGAYADRPDVLVLGLPRGGVPVAYEVARALGAPLDVMVVRKLGVPSQPELAMGAIASGGVRVLNYQVLEMLFVPEAVIEETVAREMQELERRERLYRDGMPAPTIADRTVILVDDGLATGSTMRAAIEAVRQLGAREVVVAVPTGSLETCQDMQAVADSVFCLIAPEPFYAVGLWYQDFSQTSDEEVRDLLRKAREFRGSFLDSIQEEADAS
ncbi:MAG TPA: phosphoribosyltransferase [Chloroflexia bacterium]|nr:phosphoribosyltransferase [Chloroflexia bacterium]